MKKCILVIYTKKYYLGYILINVFVAKILFQQTEIFVTNAFLISEETLK